jgi:hypothetical protein
MFGPTLNGKVLIFCSPIGPWVMTGSPPGPSQQSNSMHLHPANKIFKKYCRIGLKFYGTNWEVITCLYISTWASQFWCRAPGNALQNILQILLEFYFSNLAAKIWLPFK